MKAHKLIPAAFCAGFLMVGCLFPDVSGLTNACKTPAQTVGCGEQDFYVFVSQAGEGQWLGFQCKLHPCQKGDACEVQLDGTFVQGVCE